MYMCIYRRTVSSPHEVVLCNVYVWVGGDEKRCKLHMYLAQT